MLRNVSSVAQDVVDGARKPSFPRKADPDRLARERELVRRAQAGDRGAFEQIYRENVGRVYAVCLRIAVNAALAEELAQDAFVRAWQRLGSFRGDSALGSWLYTLAATHERKIEMLRLVAGGHHLRS